MKLNKILPEKRLIPTLVEFSNILKTAVIPHAELLIIAFLSEQTTQTINVTRNGDTSFPMAGSYGDTDGVNLPMIAEILNVQIDNRNLPFEYNYSIDNENTILDKITTQYHSTDLFRTDNPNYEQYIGYIAIPKQFYLFYPCTGNHFIIEENLLDDIYTDLHSFLDHKKTLVTAFANYDVTDFMRTDIEVPASSNEYFLLTIST